MCQAVCDIDESNQSALLKKKKFFLLIVVFPLQKLLNLFLGDLLSKTYAVQNLKIVPACVYGMELLFLEKAYLWRHSLQRPAKKFDICMLLFTELTKMKIQVWKQHFVLQILLIRSVSPDKNRKIDTGMSIYLICLCRLLQDWKVFNKFRKLSLR